MDPSLPAHETPGARFIFTPVEWYGAVLFLLGLGALGYIFFRYRSWQEVRRRCTHGA
ncbi:MAG: hypothetical protein ACLFU2_14070 [Opitutales bacterium]